MADHEMNQDPMFKHFDELRERVQHALHREPVPVRLGMLFSCLVAATDGLSPQLYMPFLASFLGTLAQRDGVMICSHTLLDEDDDGDGEQPAATGERLH